MICKPTRKIKCIGCGHKETEWRGPVINRTGAGYEMDCSKCGHQIAGMYTLRKSSPIIPLLNTMIKESEG